MKGTIEFTSGRLDKCAATDKYCDELRRVYFDFDRRLAYATDGFVLTVKELEVTGGDLEGVAFLPIEAAAWLLAGKKKLTELAFREVKGTLIARNGRRESVAYPDEPKDEPLVDRAWKIAEGTLVQKEGTTAILDCRNLWRIRAAIGPELIILPGEETTNPLLIVGPGGVAILMPLYFQNPEHGIDKGRSLLKRLE